MYMFSYNNKYMHTYYQYLTGYIYSLGIWLLTRDAPILLFFSPIFLSGNSFFSNLLCSIFCSKFQHFAQSLAK